MLRVIIMLILLTGVIGCSQKSDTPAAGTGSGAAGAKIAQPPAVPPKSPGPSA